MHAFASRKAHSTEHPRAREKIDLCRRRMIRAGNASISKSKGKTYTKGSAFANASSCFRNGSTWNGMARVKGVADPQSSFDGTSP